jgi:predicted Zn-dependent peptidase
MIKFDKFILDNGLKVIVHQDKTSPIVAINIVYDVGASDENPEKTGFAHLFEHLMFGGSINIPSYDSPLQLVGGENNAFTNNDITNYYLTLPKENIETGFWLESDRMLSLAFSEKSLEVQRGVVIEEFKQRYLNQPYGDMYLLIRDMAYIKHPYKWATIGKEISHIENATMKDVKNFFYKHYAPNNAVLTVVGNVTLKEIKPLVRKYFSNIEKREIVKRNLPKEPKQTKLRTLTVERDVPNDIITKAYHMCNRLDKNYHATDLLSDVLSNGDSSRLTRKLVKEQKLFIELNAYILGSRDEGLFIISGKPNKGIEIKEAEKAIQKEINCLIDEGIEDNEFQKLKNKVEASLIFSQMSVLNKAMNLGISETINDANDVNTETEKYQNVKKEDVLKIAKQILNEENCSTLYYLSKQK